MRIRRLQERVAGQAAADQGRAKRHEASMTEVANNYEQEGFGTQFVARPGGMVHCTECADDTASEQVTLHALHRFEGTSDPGDQAVLVAIECPSCGALGTLGLSYGPGASPEDMGVLDDLLDDRTHSGMEIGR